MARNTMTSPFGGSLNRENHDVIDWSNHIRGLQDSLAASQTPFLDAFPRKFGFSNVALNGTVLTNGSIALENGTLIVPPARLAPVGLDGGGPSDFVFLVQLGCLFALWYIFNIYFNIYNKQVLKVYPYPITITAFQFALGGIIALLMWGLGLYDLPHVTKAELSSIVPVAVAHALGNLFTNMSVKDVAVSFTHVIKSLEPFFSVTLSSFVFHQTPSIAVILSLVPTVGGVALASVTEVSFNWKGFLSAMASNLTFQSRNVLSKQILLEQVSIDNINLFCIITMMSFLLMLPMTLLGEQAAYRPEAVKSEVDIKKAATRAFLAGVCFHSYQQVSYMILQRVTPVTHAVGNCMKRVLVIVASVVFFRTPVSYTNAAGIGVALLGVFAYSQAKAGKFKPS